jgi:small subunit ribosomal protein S17
MTAVVVSRSGDKTIKVAVQYKVVHPKYGKYVRQRTTMAVHDEQNKAEVGDKIRIAECRPYSKTKCWRLVDVLEKPVEARV